jgi:transposase InsO family protein
MSDAGVAKTKQLSAEASVNVHKNAKLAPAGRALLVQRLVGGERRAAVAAAFGVSERTAGKWLARYRREGPAGLVDRSSRPRRCPHQLRAGTVRRIERLRRRRWTSPAIAQRLGIAPSTVGLTLRRLGLNRLRALEPRPPIIRYERAQPGELVHVDTKKLARIHRVGHRIHGDRRVQVEGAGWEHLHVCIDDATRLAYTEMLPAEDRFAATAFVQRAAAWFGQLGVHIERVMTDNAFAYRSHAYQAALQHLGVRHVRTRPYTPRTNGKAERFIQTCLREWAYRRPYRHSAARTAALPAFTQRYNVERPHTALQRRPPLARLLELSEQRA